MLYLQPAASFGGAERQAAQNIRRLPEHGVEVLPIVGPGRQIVDFLEDAGVRRYLFRADLPDDPKAPRGRIAQARLIERYVRAFFRTFLDVEREARRFEADLVFASRPFAWVAAGMAAASLGVPSLWRVGTHFEHWLQQPLLAGFSRVWRPRAIVCTSSAILGAVGRTIGAPAFVVHNGVDTARFSPSRRVPHLRGALGVPEGTPVLAFVGRIAPEKGPELLVEACANIAARNPTLRLLVAGDSPWRGRLEAALAARGLAGRAHLLGFVREVEQVYATADVVVSTSHAEGCPNAVLEAMAMGRPVVATRVGGTSEIMRDGIDGRLVPPHDAAGFAAAVSELLEGESVRRRLGAAAAVRIAEHFSLDAQVAQLAAAIRWTAGVQPAARSLVQTSSTARDRDGDRDGDVAVQHEAPAGVDRHDREQAAQEERVSTSLVGAA